MAAGSKHIRINQARLVTNDQQVLVIASSPLNGLGLALVVVTLAAFGAWVITVDYGYTIMGIIAIGLAAAVAFGTPGTTNIRFDFGFRTLEVSSRSLARPLKQAAQTHPLSALAQAGLVPVRLGRPNTIDILLHDGSRLTVAFSEASHAKLAADRLGQLAGSEAAPNLNSPQAAAQAAVSESQGLMQRELRSWAAWLLVMGVAQFVFAGGFSSWGLLLISLGLASFYFRTASMFVVFACNVAWAGLTNLLAGAGPSIGFALFQAYLSYRLFQSFRRFHHAESAERAAAALSPFDAPARRDGAALAPNAFPLAALVIGLACAAVVATVAGGIFASGFVVVPLEVWIVLAGIEPLAVDAAVLAFALGLGSLLAGYPRKAAAWAGLAAGALTVLTEVGLAIFLAG